METGSGLVRSDFVARLIADYKLALFARTLLETRSVAAAVGRED
jgi:hypothetical protein